MQAYSHGKTGHPSYLFGKKSPRGWWYYQPAVALYKVPLGLWLLMLLTPLSLRKVPPKWDEWGLALPAIAWAGFLMSSRISIGFRHFLPCYLFLIMISTRCFALRGRAWSIACFGAVLAVALHSASYHPDYLSYLNFPRDKAYLAISDSNVDWGQSLKQVRAWLDEHPPGNRPVTLGYFGNVNAEASVNVVEYYLGDRVALLNEDTPLPTSGLLIVSPVVIAGPYEKLDRFGSLRDLAPADVIGSCMLVYDLDRIGQNTPPAGTAAPKPRESRGRPGGSSSSDPISKGS